MNRNRATSRLLFFLVGLAFLFSLPASAYIGPGAGFAFLSSFLVLFLTFFLAIFSFLSWPFRYVIRMIRGKRALKGALVDRVVIVGLDGLEPSLAEQYMAEGKLPNLAKLKKDGTYVRLQTTTPAISPVAWSSFMTGSEPSKHNIFDFLSRDPRTYLPSLSSAHIGKPKKVLSIGKYAIPLSKPEIRGMRKSVPFWKILGEAGIFSTVLRVPITFPPEKFAGHLLSGMCAPDLKGSQGTFAFYTSDPEKIRKREGGIAIPVEVNGNRITTHISGPDNALLKKSEEIRIPMQVEIDRDKNQVSVVVSGQKFNLKLGTFSPWTKITFKPGLGMKVKAVARFYVSQLQPHFEMYMTPLNIDPEKPALPISHPFIYSVYLSKLLGSFITLGEANDTWALNEGALREAPFLELTYSNHQEWESMLFNALAKTKKGAVVCVFETTDSIQHMFFRYLDNAHPALKTAPAEMSPQVIEDLYRRMDGLIGRVQEKLDSRSALIIMSDHGFKSFRRGVNLNSWLCLNGYLRLKERDAESDEWFKNVDWDKTRAYALGLGGVYINQKNREARGIVAAGDEAKALKAELIRKLTGLRDEAVREVAITEVYDRDKVYSGPYRENAPDLIIGYNQGYRASWDSVTGKVNVIIFEDNPKAWSGDHCIDPKHVPGVFFFSRKINAKTATIMDVAPTVLTLFGLPVPAHMDGHSLVGAAGPAAAPNKGKKK
jgi:predicted AlkP superfamily phosphohydrolase/phosphomutase